jgi:aldehyde dehydrogenase (NAD+)
VFSSVSIGNPFDGNTLIGRPIDRGAYDAVQKALTAAQQDNGRIHGGGRYHVPDCPDGYYVRPALIEMPAQTDIVMHETFAPILYVRMYEGFDDALAQHSRVPRKGCCRRSFSTDLREVELLLSSRGSDRSMANVNMAPSGAEIGGDSPC